MALHPFSTIRLKDRDTAYIGKANALAVSASGEFFVTDLLSRRVLRFNKLGEFMSVIGRQGGGPNEFEGPSWLTSIDDTTLAVVDLSRRNAVVWDLNTARARARLALPGVPGALVEARGALYAAMPDLQHGTAGARWRLPETEPFRMGKLLPEYMTKYAPIWGNVAMAVRDDTIAYFGGHSQFVILADSMWNPIDSIPVPQLQRRGIPAEIDYRVGGGRNIYDVMDQLSVPFRLHFLSGARMAVMHLDASVIKNNVVGRVYLTVLQRSGAPLCVDVVVPTHDSTTIPRIAFRSDTLFVLDHFVQADSAIAEVRKYMIDRQSC